MKTLSKTTSTILSDLVQNQISVYKFYLIELDNFLSDSDAFEDDYPLLSRAITCSFDLIKCRISDLKNALNDLSGGGDCD